MNANARPLPSAEQLEAMKSRFSHLVHSLTALITELRKFQTEPGGAPLPDWPSLHAQFSVLQQQLSSLSSALAVHQEALSHTVAYPLPHFPTRTQEPMLGELLRKKLTPDVEKWVNEGFKIGTEIENSAIRDNDIPPNQRLLPLASFTNDRRKKRSEDDDEDDGPRELNWAMRIVAEEVRARDWDAEYTLEELNGGWKNVATGLIVDDEGKAVRKPAVDEEEEKKKKEPPKPKVRERPAGPRPRIHIPEKHMVVDPETGGLRLETLFRFLSSGIHPAALMHPEDNM